MTKPKFILNPEQLEAKAQEARDKNPNKNRIAELREQVLSLNDQIGELVTNDEISYGILEWMAKDKEARAAVSLMENQELGVHLVNLFAAHCVTDFDTALLDRALVLIGYVQPDTEPFES